MRFAHIALLCAVELLLVASSTFASDGASQIPQVFPNGVVAADHPAASEAGASILRKGGNVVDAAVATSFALSVVRPASCGVGGGGFMLIWDARQKKSVAIDYRERAPSHAAADQYGDAIDGGKAEPVSVRGGLAVGVPGTVAGLCYAAEKYGTLPLDQLLQPAIDLCRNGVEIDLHDFEVQTSALKTIHAHNGYAERFAPLITGYLNGGVKWKTGDRFHSPQLPVLERIASHGAAGFYEGEVAVAICQTVGNESGKMVLTDLKNYEPTERSTLQARFGGREVVTMPPPSSGGIALLQTLQALEAWERTQQTSLKSLGHNSPEYVHTVAEILKHVFADRAEFLGDTDFVSVPVARLLNLQYAAQIAAHVDPKSTRPLEAYGRFFLHEDAGTSHFSVIDTQGNAVACTTVAAGAKVEVVTLAAGG